MGVSRPASVRSARPATIPLLRPSIGREEERLVLQALRSGRLTQGPMVDALERELAEAVGAREAIAVSSGTAALYLALQVAGVRPGDEVIVPSFTFVATANVVSLLGARPVFVDIDPATYNLDVGTAAACVTKATRAIMPVHQVGLPCDRDAVYRLADQRGLAVVEDAACALGARWKGKPIGAGTRLACFSFHPRKVVTSGEGGAVVTDDPALAERLRTLRSHGLVTRPIEGQAARQECVEPAFNFRLSDISAALALAQVRRLEELVDARRTLAERYGEGLAGIRGLVLPTEPASARHTYQTYLVRLTTEARRDRDSLLTALNAAGIEARVGVVASHLQPAHRTGGVHLPETERAARGTLALPLYPGLTRAQQGKVIRAVRKELE